MVRVLLRFGLWFVMAYVAGCRPFLAHLNELQSLRKMYIKS